jgi:hypothetical protein
MRLTVSHEQLTYLTSLHAGGHVGTSVLPPTERLRELLHEGCRLYQFELSTVEFVELYRNCLLVLPWPTLDVLVQCDGSKQSAIDLQYVMLR